MVKKKITATHWLTSLTGTTDGGVKILKKRLRK
jgi:hypothetical protein